MMSMVSDSERMESMMYADSVSDLNLGGFSMVPTANKARYGGGADRLASTVDLPE